MRVVLDTNILISALLVPSGNPARIYRAWQERNFLLLTCPQQLDELRESLRRPALAARIKTLSGGATGKSTQVPGGSSLFTA